jgi:hypothetical protein
VGNRICSFVSCKGLQAFPQFLICVDPFAAQVHFVLGRLFGYNYTKVCCQFLSISDALSARSAWSFLSTSAVLSCKSA